MARPYRFEPPSSADWAASWEPINDPAARAAYNEACWSFDAQLAPLLPDGTNRDALEIGCYPGGFMRYLNQRFHYTVSGVDYVPATAGLADTLRADGVDVGTVYVADVRELQPDPRFDLVASFGFIEHFDDPAEMIRRHIRWLAPSGWLLIEVPHFRRVQWGLHRMFDAASLRGHNVAAMDHGLLQRTLTDAGMVIRHLGYVGVCGFWFEPAERSPANEAGARAARALFGKADSVLRRSRLNLANPVTSPFLLCVAQRS